MKKITKVIARLSIAALVLTLNQIGASAEWKSDLQAHGMQKEIHGLLAGD